MSENFVATQRSYANAEGSLRRSAPGCTAALVLEDGSAFWGRGAGATGVAIGEVCFNTSISGYQEILSDPSYAEQIITFTFPHIGNVGTNADDMEAKNVSARGCVFRSPISAPSNWRSTTDFDAWLKAKEIVALSGVDTRKLTAHLRDKGAMRGALIHDTGARIDREALVYMATSVTPMEGLDLATKSMCERRYEWDAAASPLDLGAVPPESVKRHVVALDFGAKHNLFRILAHLGSRVTVVPGVTSFEAIMNLAPDGVFISNGPGDPAATAPQVVPAIRRLLELKVPIFGVCLGHQLLALAVGARTKKMHFGHRGANHPVKELETGRVVITSQNHGFVVDEASLPEGVVISHVSLFDGSNEGIVVKNAPAFSVQYHPEASPGPQDSRYLFERFVALVDRHGRNPTPVLET